MYEPIHRVCVVCLLAACGPEITGASSSEGLGGSEDASGSGDGEPTGDRTLVFFLDDTQGLVTPPNLHGTRVDGTSAPYECVAESEPTAYGELVVERCYFAEPEGTQIGLAWNCPDTGESMEGVVEFYGIGARFDACPTRPFTACPTVDSSFDIVMDSPDATEFELERLSTFATWEPVSSTQGRVACEDVVDAYEPDFDPRILRAWWKCGDVTHALKIAAPDIPTGEPLVIHDACGDGYRPIDAFIFA